MSKTLEYYVKRILKARIYDLVVESPLSKATFLSNSLDNTVLLKREDLQPVHSFKLRGAYNYLLQMSNDQRKGGVVTASAGNHALGLAYSSRHLGITPTIVMPTTTPHIKVKAVDSLGAKIVLHGETYNLASKYAKELSQHQNKEYVPAYDHPDVIAGQGTIAMEISRQCADSIYAVFIPVGGGGLCAGMAAYLKHVHPETKVIAVESEESACLLAAMQHKKPVPLQRVGIFADGVAVNQIGSETFSVLKDSVDEVVVVTNDEICAAMKDIFDDTRAIVEPSGALSLAGMKKYVSTYKTRNKVLVAVTSGANVDFNRLRFVSERAESGEGTEVILSVTLPEVKGSYKRLCEALGNHRITEFNYRYTDGQEAHVFLGVAVNPDKGDRYRLIESLNLHNYQIVDLTDNRVASCHIRYMIGGRGSAPLPEQVFSIEVLEYKGALLHLLNEISTWNISMFHYRNHGAARGMVLLGLHANEYERPQIEALLDSFGYFYTNETKNSAYHYFLR